MKKALFVTLGAALLLTVSACSANSATIENPKGAYIEAIKLTEEEQELVSLIRCGGSMPGISRFTVGDTKKLEIIFDVYKSGVLIDTNTYAAGTFTEKEGKIAVVPDRTDPNLIDISLTYSGGNSGGNSMIWWLQEDYNTDKMLYTDLFNSTIKTAVDDSGTYMLFARFFSDSQGMTVPPDILNNSEMLKELDYAYVIFCRFSSGHNEDSAQSPL